METDTVVLILLGLVLILLATCLYAGTCNRLRSCTITNTALLPRAHARRIVAMLHAENAFEGPVAFPIQELADAIEKSREAEVCVLYENREKMGFFDSVQLFSLKLRSSFHRIPVASYDEFKQIFGQLPSPYQTQ